MTDCQQGCTIDFIRVYHSVGFFNCVSTGHNAMAQEKVKPKRRLRPAETVREKATKQASKAQKPRRVKRIVSGATRPLSRINSFRKKEYYLPLPDNRLGRFLNKRRHIVPMYFRNAFKELKDVNWPNRRQTLQLTIAVFIFAFVFGVLISLADYGLDKIFKQILLK